MSPVFGIDVSQQSETNIKITKLGQQQPKEMNGKVKRKTAFQINFICVCVGVPSFVYNINIIHAV